MADPIKRKDLYWLSEDRPWLFVIDANAPVDDIRRDAIYFAKHLVESVPKQLHPDVRLHDADVGQLEQLIVAAVQQTLQYVQAITAVGALTRREPPGHRDPSMDYLCHGAFVAKTWLRSVVTVRVRERELEPGIAPVTGPVNFGVTLVPLGEVWEGIIQGDPIPEGYATYLINEGWRFRTDQHCLWVKPHPEQTLFPA